MTDVAAAPAEHVAEKRAYRTKLIEVALPLDAINKAAIREGYIYRGNPSALHKWWAQRPLAAARAVLFAQLVDDPSADSERFPTEETQQAERQRLFTLIEQMIQWENMNDQALLKRARAEISASESVSTFLDPFAGGGSIPLEALRLGLGVHSRELNPVAVLINRALLDFTARFCGHPPVNPSSDNLIRSSWPACTGLADDIRYYGRWMRDSAYGKLAGLYPPARLPDETGGVECTVLAWLWARTVVCPNPACGRRMPLLRSLALSTKKGHSRSLLPRRDADSQRMRFDIDRAPRGSGEGTVDKRGAKCVFCSTAAALDYLRSQGAAGDMQQQLTSMVVESPAGREYLPSTPEQERTALRAQPTWAPDTDLPKRALGFRVQAYGMTKHRDLFTRRQLATLTTLCDLIEPLRRKVRDDAIRAGMSDDAPLLREGGRGAGAYADAVATYLCFAIDKYAPYGNSLVPWFTKEDRPSWIFGRQTINMVWDFAEINPFSGIGGSFDKSIEIVAESIVRLQLDLPAEVSQGDATVPDVLRGAVISTDPPYYDNISYSDLSDFFYVWLRHCLRDVHPDLFKTVLTPKREELVADEHRYGGKESARTHFVEGIQTAFGRLREAAHPDLPVTIYYAFKQSDSTGGSSASAGELGTASTGWETMLEGLIRGGFTVVGTWPIRTERAGRLRGAKSNALASSIVLVCRARSTNAPIATRREFQAELRRHLREALVRLESGGVAPADFAQAAIGPGMAVFSRFGQVLEANGEPMTVRTALELINAEVDAIRQEQEGDLDAETRFCLAWFNEYGFRPGEYGRADVVARAKNTAPGALARAGLLEQGAGKVRLLSPAELDPNWSPLDGHTRITDWGCTHHLIRTLSAGGEDAAAALVRQIGSGKAKIAVDLAYRLFETCTRKNWNEEALAYNALGASWPAIQQKASGEEPSAQGTLI